MNGKNVLHSFDLDHRYSFDEEIDTTTELNRNSIVRDGKDLFDLEADAELVQFDAMQTRYGLSNNPGPNLE